VLLPFGCQFSLSLVSMALALSILLVRVLDRDGFAEKVLSVHGGFGSITSLERVEADEAIALRNVVFIADDTGLS